MAYREERLFAVQHRAVPLFERVPLDIVAAAMILFLCIYALGPVTALASSLCFGLIALSRWRAALWILLSSWLFLLLPVWAVYSAAWSDLPSISVRYGLQFLLTALMGVFIAHVVPLRRIPLVLWSGTFVAIVLGILSGRTGLSVEGPVLIGLTGSKNQWAYLSLFWLLSSLAVVTDANRAWLIRLLALTCTVPSMFLIYQADATTALLSAICAVALFVILSISRWLPTGARVFCLFATVAAALSLAAAAPELEDDAQHFRADVLEKDATLTGRTILWRFADDAIEEHPVIGHGYKAFWFGRQGSGLLARFDQRDPRAYNFHDTFRDIAVDLGYVGLILFVLAMSYAVVKTLLLVVTRPDPGVILVMAIIVVVGIRTKVELVVAPMLFDTVLLWMAFGYARLGKVHQSSPDVEAESYSNEKQLHPLASH